jgi:hypothetical protein
MDFKILTDKLPGDYISVVNESPLDTVDKIQKTELPVDYLQYYRSVSSVYSSRPKGRQEE